MKCCACYIALLLVALWCSVLPVQADEDYAAAGIALIARHGGGDLVLLVKHHSRSWYEMPGGRRKAGDDTNPAQSQHDETAYDTAIRECYEESKGYLQPELLRKLVDPAHRLRDGGFVFFVARIDWFALSELPGKPAPEHENTHAFHEIVDYAWVPVTNVINSEDGTAVDIAGRRLELRRQLKPRLIEVAATGWLQ